MLIEALGVTGETFVKIGIALMNVSPVTPNASISIQGVRCDGRNIRQDRYRIDAKWCLPYVPHIRTAEFENSYKDLVRVRRQRIVLHDHHACISNPVKLDP